MARIGQVIDGKYEILKEIGRGGMSIVYLAMDKRLNKQWAVKEIPKRALDKNNEVVVQSAIAEANMIKRLDHPAIVRIVDIINNDDVIYIIEDYIEGETLGTIVENNGAQPQELVIEWAMQICEALEYLHTRKPPIIYRDMKPTNVMLKPEGNVKIIDFGIAREYKERGLADTVSLGTRGYAAPEQFGGRGQTDARTDVYCLGVTMYHWSQDRIPVTHPMRSSPSVTGTLSCLLDWRRSLKSARRPIPMTAIRVAQSCCMRCIIMKNTARCTACGKNESLACLLRRRPASFSSYRCHRPGHAHKNQ